MPTNVMAPPRATMGPGRVGMTEPVTKVRLDTLAGLVTAKVSIKDGEVGEVTIRNVVFFIYS